ncbi:uncharacterized [Tachysurus ichikawai]
MDEVQRPFKSPTHTAPPPCPTSGKDFDELQGRREGSHKAQRTIKVFLINSQSGASLLDREAECPSHDGVVPPRVT